MINNSRELSDLLGRVFPCDDGSGDCYVWYHQGNTASRTPYSCLRRISNLYAFAIRRIQVDEEMTMPA